MGREGQNGPREMSECDGQMVGGAGADCCDAALLLLKMPTLIYLSSMRVLFLPSNGVKLGLAVVLWCELPVVSVARPYQCRPTDAAIRVAKRWWTIS